WKKKEKAEAREAAREGGDEAAGRVAAIEGLTRAGHRALALGAGREAVGCFRKALLLSRDMVSPQIHRACAFNLGAAYVETGKPKKGLEFLLQSQPSEAESRDHLGRLYFNVGAAHEGLRDFPKALECFEKVAGHASAAQAGGRVVTPVSLALGFAGRAGSGWGPVFATPGALGNRRAQGQCFGNLAYACSQLGNHGAAAENYLHALQAFRDSGDLQGQWQACEGLGSACFHLGDPQKAIGHYQEALILLSHCQDSPRAAHKRVVHKLTDAIQRRLRLSHLSYQGGWAPTPALEPSQLQFCSTLPRASRTWLQGSEVGKAQAADELLMCMPGACPRHSGTGVAPTGGLALEPCNPHGLLGTSGEDDDGPSSAPGYHSEPKVNSKRTTSPLHPAKPPHAGPRLRKYHTQPELGFPSEPRPVGLTLHSSGHQNHQTLHPRAPER
ncbi:PREDICTED: tetratricopeptide repeat protein 24, partial [Corvus brachyrhynchos]|uniref:tetratricopeptide repeat protein 24 n=1 Tax=Corvus brachyrhynchos TaxID=85066 RepID=UPI0008167BC1